MATINLDETEVVGFALRSKQRQTTKIFNYELQVYLYNDITIIFDLRDIPGRAGDDAGYMVTDESAESLGRMLLKAQTTAKAAKLQAEKRRRGDQIDGSPRR